MVKIAFRVNASFKTGSGHLQRCLALASGFKETEPACGICFLTSDSEEYAKMITGAGHAHIDLGHISSTYHDVEATISMVEKNGIDILVTDTYAIDEKYLKSLKGEVAVLAVIDDMMRLKSYHAQAIANPNIYAHLLQYDCDADTELFLGTEFAQLRPEFDQYQEFVRENPEKARRILISFGGSDIRGGSILAVKALKAIGDRFSATIITGRAFRQGEELAREIGLDSRFNVMQDVSDIAKRMAAADLAIASPSTTFSELMLFRTPSVLITQADNQEMVAEYAGKNGLALSLGDIGQISESQLTSALAALISGKDARDRMSARMDGLVDGMGRFRLAEAILRIFEDKKQSI